MRFLAVSAVMAMASAPSAPQGQPDIGDQCVAMYAGALSRVTESSRLNTTLSTLHTNICSASNKSITAGFDSTTTAIISTVPVVSELMGRFGYKNNKQFCEGLKRGDFKLENVDTFETEPVVEAMEQANACLRIRRSANLIITHSVLDPGKVVFTGEFTRPDASVRFSAATTGNFACESPRPNTKLIDPVGVAEITRDRANFSVTCTRAPVAKPGANGDTEYSAGAISLLTSQDGAYTVFVQSDAMLGLRSRSEARASIDDALARVKAATADRDRVAAEFTRVGKRTYRPVRWFFGEAKLSNSGLHLGCPARHITKEALVERARSKVCTAGNLINVSRVKSYKGDNCGYNFFEAVCETLPPS